MKVTVTEKNKTCVAARSLDIGDGFIYCGQPHIVGESTMGDFRGFVTAFNLRTSKFVAIPQSEEVQLSQINVEYTI
ncbi:hypothetical protein [Salmonella phage SSE121]|uniref:Uncharacterized protein n=2 Tax=Seunavirus TaxID=1914851 RepID=K4I3M3_9CAUD|nr:hypothetical protein ACQ19_gp146 [Salmonella phage SSE121]AFU63787.1 hypothetical protein [Salmonella phage SSE121]QXL90472.1 hypothetical protein [Salmonella phage NINP13076]